MGIREREKETYIPVDGLFDAEDGDGSAIAVRATRTMTKTLVAGSSIARPPEPLTGVLLHCRLFLTTSGRPVESI